MKKNEKIINELKVKSISIGKSLTSKTIQKILETVDTSSSLSSTAQTTSKASRADWRANDWKSTIYTLKPLDLILFNGHDAVANLIQKIEATFVKPEAMNPFTPLWTHAGVIVDKSVLPLDCLDDGKMYIYESIFSGTVLGFTYSEILPVDQPSSARKKRHTGPQIRCLESVVQEAQADVGVCSLTSTEYQKLISNQERVRELMFSFHQLYKDHTYPFTILPQLAAASDELYLIMKWIKKKKKENQAFDEEELEMLSIENQPSQEILANSSHSSSSSPFASRPSSAQSSPLNNQTKKKKKAVFCSELAALLYEHLDVLGFHKGHAGKYTPVEVEAVSAFEKQTYFIKHEGQTFIKSDGKSVVAIQTNE